MKDITNEFNEFQRGLLVKNCPDGIMIGGHCREGQTYHRRFTSETMADPRYPDEVFVRTGEIFQNEYNNPVIVYRLKEEK